MRMTIFGRFCVTALMAAGATCVQAQVGAWDTEENQQTLRELKEVDTNYHPDLYGEYNGILRFAQGDYKGAMENFKVGAYYSDKASQMAIGLMYLNGEGVPKDPVAAYAWTVLASERAYSGYAAIRDGIKTRLTPEQLVAAQTLRARLAETYADAVAKPRLASQLRLGFSEMTGSRVGFEMPGFQVSAFKNTDTLRSPCSRSFYDKRCWDPEKYFALRDLQFKATVTVGKIEQEKDQKKP